MFSFRAGATAALTVFSLLGLVLAVPLSDKLSNLTPGARDLLKRSTPAAPHFVVYNDAWVSFPSASELKGYSVYALSFWLTSGASDMALAWEQLSESQRQSLIQEYNAAGIQVIVSAFGATSTPTTAGANAVSTANKLASWVKKHGLQGVDVDYEDLTAFDSQSGAAEQWVISLTQQLRKHLPQGEYLLTHAPLAPWFSPNKWSGNGYLGINRAVGDLVDFYNIQFYNQGSTEYTTCEGLLTKSSNAWPETAVFQIAANGVDQDKIVIGKPATASDAVTGYMSPEDLAGCVGQAHGSGWNAGVMVWEHPDANAEWIATVRGGTF